MSLPDDRDARNAIPIWDGVLAYFPDAWAEIAKVSVLGNKQHNIGDKLFFNRNVSTDHLNKVMRHLLDHEAGKVLDVDGTRHLAKAAWRVLAALQVSIEKEGPEQVALGQQAIGSLGVPWAHAKDCPYNWSGTNLCNCGAALNKAQSPSEPC
jgi:hypothetical protein